MREKASEVNLINGILQERNDLFETVGYRMSLARITIKKKYFTNYTLPLCQMALKFMWI